MKEIIQKMWFGRNSYLAIVMKFSGFMTDLDQK